MTEALKLTGEKSKIKINPWVWQAMSWIGFALFTYFLGQMEFVFQYLFPDLDNFVYSRSSFPQLVQEHIFLVALSGGLAILIGLLLGIAVTRQSGKDFLPMVNSLTSLAQTFPPVAILAVAVPIVGFGDTPTIIALLIYGLLPIVRNTITGISAVKPEVLDAARGMGMTPFQVLWKVEIPLSFSLILAGIRTSTMINIGTATLGATIGAGGLGAPIISGLIGENPAYVLQGALLVGIFAMLTDSSLNQLEKSFLFSERREY